MFSAPALRLTIAALGRGTIGKESGVVMVAFVFAAGGCNERRAAQSRRLPRAPVPAHKHCHARSPRFQNRWQRRWAGAKARARRRARAKLCGAAWGRE